MVSQNFKVELYQSNIELEQEHYFYFRYTCYSFVSIQVLVYTKISQKKPLVALTLCSFDVNRPWNSHLPIREDVTIIT